MFQQLSSEEVQQTTEKMADSAFIDYYELLQISPHAEPETIQRVFKMLAKRYHPDNRETGDADHFRVLSQAFEILNDPNERAAYDQIYKRNVLLPIGIFETKEFSSGIDGESNRRIGVLCLLYSRRRSNPDDPSYSLLEFETLMCVPREHLLFTMWFLKEHHYIRQDESSDYMITGAGVDYVEANLPTNRLLYNLLKAAERGATHATGIESASGQSS